MSPLLTETSIKLNQPALIQRIIDSLNLKDQYQHNTLADSVLFKDSEGKPRKTNFSLLVSNWSIELPDIFYSSGYSVRHPPVLTLLHWPKAQPQSSCKVNHALPQAVLTMKALQWPLTKAKAFNAMIDANFAGTFNKPNTSDPTSCLSWTGYVISYANCPILWSSKMQSIITLSTTEAKYIALSAALRDCYLHFATSYRTPRKWFPSPYCKDPPMVSCGIFKDNAGTLELTNNPKLLSMPTKHIAIPYHHFRHHVNAGAIIIEKVAIQENLANIFTKPLPLVTFRHLRCISC